MYKVPSRVRVARVLIRTIMRKRAEPGDTPVFLDADDQIPEDSDLFVVLDHKSGISTQARLYKYTQENKPLRWR